MARAIGPGGMNDVHSVAILEDLTFARNPCASGTTQLKRERYYGSTFYQSLPDNHEVKDPKKFDRKKDWIACLCAMIISMVVLGILQSIGLLLPHVKAVYGMGTLEVMVVSAGTYSLLFCLSPLASCMCRWMGHRLTCILGLLLFFVGLLLDALEIHLFVYYISHLLLISFGGCLAVNAAGSSVQRRFRKRLQLALTLISVAAPLGTIFFHLMFYFLAMQTHLTYKWTMVIAAVLALVCIALTYTLPTCFQPPRHPSPFHSRKRKKITEHCLEEVSKENAVDRYRNTFPEANPQQENEAQGSWLCVCILDVSAVTDMSFLLWAVVSSCAVTTIYCPYLFLVWYAHIEFAISILDGVCIMLWYSVATIGARVFVFICGNYTFLFNRTLFQFGCIGNAVMYLLLHEANTYGWLLVWALLAGLLEGIIVSSIPRVTLLTIPRRYIRCCWAYLIFFNGFCLIIGPFLMVSVNRMTGGDIGLACIAIGIIQVGGGIMATFIPNEEYLEDEEARAELEEEDESYGIPLTSADAQLFRPSALDTYAPNPRLLSKVDRTLSTICSSGYGTHRDSGPCLSRPPDTDYIRACPVCAECALPEPGC